MDNVTLIWFFSCTFLGWITSSTGSRLLSPTSDSSLLQNQHLHISWSDDDLEPSDLVDIMLVHRAKKIRKATRTLLASGVPVSQTKFSTFIYPQFGVGTDYYLELKTRNSRVKLVSGPLTIKA
ncbi:hypothetical protein K493DRAFT_32675 [Basidiobolus meristosporus CBS 931.73]|uniref:Yeast cell wall synthesis Kre9/Knh1-like N-terminal domain-containing protein n=1 Tax=Basidiobolus meristosporus CBS 931.73 TaxID=1314790 RepID=A0A1Y1Y7U6_9FUNG|nr:hypothetical protein K493DRAFT_32675 [Basidiobolus meristosporus CBS 931.73]|eukprot:ORX94048.1 hypothetical protein K493DRAFT_32675 [Basidiobolus meristosporus CBS 931.73]